MIFKTTSEVEVEVGGVQEQEEEEGEGEEGEEEEEEELKGSDLEVPLLEALEAGVHLREGLGSAQGVLLRDIGMALQVE